MFSRKPGHYWSTTEAKSALKNHNLQKLRQIDKEIVRETKRKVREMLEQKKNDPQFLNRLTSDKDCTKLDKNKLGGILGSMGYDFDPTQLDILMFYVDPYHQGAVQPRQVEKAAQKAHQLNDNVTEDLQGNYSVSRVSSGTSLRSNNSNLSQRSTATQQRVENLATLLKEKTRNGMIPEEDFKSIVKNQMPHLHQNDIDQLVSEAVSRSQNCPIVQPEPFLSRIGQLNAANEVD